MFDLGGTLFADLPPHFSESNQRDLLRTLGADQWIDAPETRAIFSEARHTVDALFLTRSFYRHKSLVANHALIALQEMGITEAADWESLDASRRASECSATDNAVATAIDHYFAAQANAVVNNVRLRNGCHETLALLADSCQLAVVSNNADCYMWPLLHRYRLDRWLAGAFSSDELGACKPDPAIFSRAFERLGVSPHDRQRILYVGDSLTHDVGGALAAGIDVALLRPTGAQEAATADPQPTYTIGSLPELVQLLVN